MRKLAFILICALLAAGCEKDTDRNFYSLVTLSVTVQGQDSAPISVVADQSLAGTMFRNINTLQNYSIPAITGGTAQRIRPL